jgi:predicted small lipoprotein YifL
MRVVFGLSGIVATSRSVTAAASRGATLAIAAAVLAGCGQRGPLYLPHVPPLPQPPAFTTQPASGVGTTSAPDTTKDSSTGTDLRAATTLSPASAPDAASSAR